MRRMADCGGTCPDLRHGPDRAIASGGVPVLPLFSKDAIIERCSSRRPRPARVARGDGLRVRDRLLHLPLVFYAFHGKERFGRNDHAPHESPAVVTVPLVLLAIPRSAQGG